jgi:hypothetical protein
MQSVQNSGEGAARKRRWLSPVWPVTNGRRRAEALPRPPGSVMDELAFWSDLLDAIEFVSVRGPDRDAGLRGGQENQRVIQTFLALIGSESLRACEDARDHAGILADLGIRRHQPAGRDGRKQRTVVIAERGPVGPRKIGVRHTHRELRKRDRTMKQQRLIDDVAQGRCKTSRRPVDVDVGIEQQN